MEQITTPFDTIIQYLPYLIPLVLLQLVLMIIALVDLVRRERVKWLPKWAWTLIIIFGETIGSIVYLVVGREE